MNEHQLDTLDILEKITDGFCELDRDWKIIYVNNEAERIIGLPKEKLLAKSVWDEFKETKGTLLYDNFHYAMEKQESLNFDFYNPIMKKWFDIRLYPSIRGLSVYFLDITDQKKISLKQEQYYQALFDNNPDAVYHFDLAGRFISVNNVLESLTGYSEEELLRLTFHPFIEKKDFEKVNYYFHQALKGIPQEYECRVIHKNGKIIPCIVSNIPIIIDNEIVGVYGIAKDITLQKVAKDSIENSEKLLLVGQLAASIAHEIRNPLTTIKGFLELTKEQDTVFHDYREIILSEMKRLETVTSELSLLAKPHENEFNYEMIKEIIHDVVTLLKPQALMNSIDIIFKSEDVGAIYCVSNQIKQVFINIIKNAIESMSEGGMIKVNLLNYDNDNVLIEVIDQGCGISDELASKMGLAFYSTKEKGTGLGMMTTYKLVDDHGGNISFNSKLNEGTTFSIYLPKKSSYEKSLPLST